MVKFTTIDRRESLYDTVLAQPIKLCSGPGSTRTYLSANYRKQGERDDQHHQLVKQGFDRHNEKGAGQGQSLTPRPL